MPSTAIIAGVGPGLGASLARRFAAGGLDLGLLARTESFLDALADELTESSVDVVAVPTDITDPAQVDAAFDTIREDVGSADVLVNHAAGGGWGGMRDLSADEFEDAWRTCAYGGFLCSKAVLPGMLDAESGTIIFTGATSAVRGRADALGFASAKFAMRGLAGSMARELGPLGIHVAHVVIDGQIRTPAARDAARGRGPETYLDPAAIAESYWDLVCQDRSAWTLELDLRPHVEEF